MTPRISAAFAGILLAAFGLFATAPQIQPKANPAEAARLNNLGAAYMNQQLFEKGLKCFQQAAELDPRLSIARLNQGIALLNLQKIDEAKAALEDALKQDPKNPNAWYNLGLLAKNTGEAQAAIDAFRHVVELDPNDADARYFLGSSYAQAKEFPQAIDAFQHALQLNPLHASAEFGLSRAYQQSTDIDHAREHLKKFQYITQNKLGAALSLAYGEQGQYSRAVEAPSAVLKAPAQIKVQFVDVTKEAGLAVAAAIGDAQFFHGPGACFLDYDNDGLIDLLVTDYGAQGGISLYHNLGHGRFEDVTAKAGLDPKSHAIACTAGDYDNDGYADLALSSMGRVLLLHNEKNGTFKDASALLPVKPNGSVRNGTWIDYDHDGDIDLFLGSSAKGSYKGSPVSDELWRNNGDGTFSDVTEEKGIAGYGNHWTALGTDYNNDRAVDIFVPGLDPVIFENPREGKFIARQPWDKHSIQDSTGIAIADFDHDGWMDLVTTHFGQDVAALSLWHNDHGKGFRAIPFPKTDLEVAFGVAAFDYDNDGWVDIAVVGQTKREMKEGKGEIRLFRNLGSDGFKDVTVDVGLDKIQLKEPRAIITGDYDGDGATDLLITQNHGPAVLLRNEGANQNHWMRLSLKGLADNKSAIGTKVEVFAGGNRQKFEIAGSSGYLGQNSTDIVVGLGDSKEADIVRMLWPTGVLQDEINVTGDRQQNFTEIDRRGSSCPTLFVWNGERYELVADMLGAGVVGHWIGPGQRDVPRPVEYVKIDRNAIREKDGGLSFRFMEPLEEAVYLDQVRVLAVDHPDDLNVYPNEYFASNPPYPEFKVVVSKSAGARSPAGAWDEHGHNVVPDLLAHRYFGDFALTQFQGFAQPHSLTLDLGEAYRGGPLWLLMHGEVEYFSANSMYAASQAGVQAISPLVEALDSNNRWVRVIGDMGFPAGGPRTMTADLTGKLPPGTQKIRITTNLQIYWDSILVSRTPQASGDAAQSPRVTPVPLVRADLGFHGFPLKIEGSPPGNVQYIYEKTSATGPYTRPMGTYTRYGDVLPLLTALDDQLVVFGSGDEVRLDFDPSKLPALPHGWVRDYFFAAYGYEKDMDFYAAEGNFVAPLPFLRMGDYPYAPGKSFPLDDAHVNYLLEYNTRHMSGNEQRGYWFDYGK
ncbi:MAG TPA: FG-GAP-like repeat-containing protein [Candidatus Sulfotelmatobacter sp.]|jgi:tetratricopeptide (TPR) repeat protein|nr:FG-GAP-like repeat-containing protein [Candidatus Sulfotelmatobacter sp.]